MKPIRRGRPNNPPICIITNCKGVAPIDHPLCKKHRDDTPRKVEYKKKAKILPWHELL